MSSFLISICIPAYKRTDFLQRLLDSISIQTFPDFEVIVSDDSPDEAVGRLCAQYSSRFTLHYFRNERSLGTPENWNAAVKQAGGTWIKIMHDDDWFADTSIVFPPMQDAACRASGISGFIFSAYCDIFSR